MPVNFIDIAPILTLISALTESGPVVSSTLPPSTHGTTRSRSRIVAKLSSIGFVGGEGVIQLDGHALVHRSRTESADIGSAHVDPGGHYRLGPENGTLSVRTGRTGAAAKAGHDLLIHVTAWEATLEVGEDPRRPASCSTPTPTSLRVREGTGGMKALDDDDKASIRETIDDEILKRQAIDVPLDRGAGRRRRPRSACRAS